MQQILGKSSSALGGAAADDGFPEFDTEAEHWKLWSAKGGARGESTTRREFERHLSPQGRCGARRPEPRNHSGSDVARRDSKSDSPPPLFRNARIRVVWPRPKQRQVTGHCYHHLSSSRFQELQC